MAKIQFSKEKGSDKSLDTDKTIRYLVEYGEDGYSTIKASGERNGEKSLYDSKRNTPIKKVDIPATSCSAIILNYIIDALGKFRK